MSFIDKVHIAITCTQRGWFDNSLGKKKALKMFHNYNCNYVFGNFHLAFFIYLEWFQNALSSIKPEDKKEDIKFAKDTYQQVLRQHDHFLEKMGPKSGEHRTFAIPFDKKLRKKKKYKKITEKKVKNPQNSLPLFEYNQETASSLQRNFMASCAGDPKRSLRSLNYDVNLFCRYINRFHTLVGSLGDRLIRVDEMIFLGLYPFFLPYNH